MSGKDYLRVKCYEGVTLTTSDELVIIPRKLEDSRVLSLLKSGNIMIVDKDKVRNREGHDGLVELASVERSCDRSNVGIEGVEPNGVNYWEVDTEDITTLD